MFFHSQGSHLSFRTVPMSLMRTFAMMLGEIDFLGTYVQPFYREEIQEKLQPELINSINGDKEFKTLPYPLPAFLILGIFMVLMPILLMNLLIGLAVGDIESVKRNAQLKRLAMQVVLHTELERKLPQILLARVDKMELIEYPNDTKCKLGFLDTVLRKWFCNPFSDDGKVDFAYSNTNNGKRINSSFSSAGWEMVLDSGEDYLTSEMEKHKRKLKEISAALETQQLFLRLIVQVS